jgi:DNA-binding FrmR family transcriptional regulator
MKKDVKQRVLRRLRIIEGQVQALQRMVDNEQYCVDVITQTSAVRQALSSVEDAMLENHLSTHVVEQMKSGKHKQATEEVLSIYKISKRK